jgi:hypothetical protein
MSKLTRRSLFAVGGTGAAGLVVAGCGTADDPRTEGRDGEVLDAAADAETTLGAIYDQLDAGPQGNPAVQQFRDASSSRLDELNRVGATTPKASLDVDASTSAAIAAADPAIAAYRNVVRFGSTTELRSTAITFLTQVSAEQATLRGLGGEDQSPQPFVTGLKAKPYVATDDTADDTTTSTTSTTSTSSTSTTTTSSTDGG